MITTEDDFSAATKADDRNTTSSDDHRNMNIKVAAAAAAAASTSWTRLKDPRIVRVSRALGGKDRHSKVCTVRGLRDRRVRLSVPTAIQLYDLQHRLGLNQPSKVVDWLLNAAKNEIDELPPLHFPPTANFNPNLQQWLCSASSHQTHAIRQGIPLESSTSMRGGKSKEVAAEDADDDDDDEEEDSQDQNWKIKSEEGKQQPQQSLDIDQNRSSGGGYHHHHPTNLFPRSHNSSSLPNLLNNAAHFNSFLRWDPSSLSLSHGAVSVPQPDQDFHNFNVLPLTSPSGLPHSFFHPQGAEFEPRQINFQMLSSGSQQQPSSTSVGPPPVHDFTSHSPRPLHFLTSHNHSGSDPNKENEFHTS